MLMIICQLGAALTLFASMVLLSNLYPLYKDRSTISPEQVYYVVHNIRYATLGALRHNTICTIKCILPPRFAFASNLPILFADMHL